MPQYYNPYSSPYWTAQNFLLYDVPLFLLFFGLIYIIVRFVVKIHDMVMSTAISIFAAASAYFIVRSQTELYTWFLFNWKGLFGAVVLLVIFSLIYFVVKTSA